MDTPSRLQHLVRGGWPKGREKEHWEQACKEAEHEAVLDANSDPSALPEVAVGEEAAPLNPRQPPRSS